MRLLISSVSVPLQPGSTKPAVAWTISPRRPSSTLALDPGDDVVGQLDPLQRAPEHELAGVDDERLAARRPRPPRSGCAAARAGRSPSRGGCGRRGTSRPGAGRPTPAAPAPGPTARSRSGPSSTRRRIVPSERTEVGTRGSPDSSAVGLGARRRVTGRTRGGGERQRARRAGRGAGGAGSGRGRVRARFARRRPRGRPSCSGSCWMAHQTPVQAAGSAASGRRTGTASSSPRGKPTSWAAGRKATGQESRSTGREAALA